MTSIPNAELNERTYSSVRAYEFGYIRLVNAMLFAFALLTVAAACFLAFKLSQVSHELTHFKPVVLRMSEIGRAEVVYYRQYDSVPRAPEVIYYMKQFTEDFFTHRQYRIKDFWRSKYMLSDALQTSTAADDQQTKWIQSVMQGGGTQYESTVDRYAILSLDEKGGAFLADFTLRFIENGRPSSRSQSWTVTYRFDWRPSVEGLMMEYNPMGIEILDFKPIQNVVAAN